MPDDPKKRGKQDRSRVSQQPHEQQYQRSKPATISPKQAAPRRTQQRGK